MTLGYDAQPIAKLLLLQELLGQVLDVSPREVNLALNLDNAATDCLDGDVVAQISGARVDFDLLLQKRRKGRGVEDGVVGGL